MTERHRARSESPGRMDEPKQLSSQVCSCGLKGAVLVEELVTEWTNKRKMEEKQQWPC